MYPQTYGTTYYGKRFPIKVEQQLSAFIECTSLIDYTKIILLHLVATADCIGKFASKNIIKVVSAATNCTAAIRKSISYRLFAVCEAGASIIRYIILMPIFALCTTASGIKKQIQKVLSAITDGIANIGVKRIVKVEFIGDFAPDDVITINSRTMEVKLNNGNALHLLKGEFISIKHGEQEILYSDDEGARKIRLKVKWRDKWL